MSLIMKTKIKKGSIAKIIIWWFLLVGFINLFSPNNVWINILFYILLSITIWKSLKLANNSRRSILWTIMFIILLLLRQNRIDNILNILLIAGILISIEIYFRIS